MESDYFALSTSYKDLSPIMNLVQGLGKFFDLPVKDKSRFHVGIHEDNVAALLLGQLEPRRMTPRSKHYAIKYHWFREHIVSSDTYISLKSKPRSSLAIFLLRDWDKYRSSTCGRSWWVGSTIQSNVSKREYSRYLSGTRSSQECLVLAVASSRSTWM